MNEEEELEKARKKIKQLEKLCEDAIALVDKHYRQCRQAKKRLSRLLDAAEGFLADYGSYINEEDWELPDPTQLERTIIRIKQQTKEQTNEKQNEETKDSD